MYFFLMLQTLKLNSFNIVLSQLITEEQMLWYTYLYENTMFTNKKNKALLGKENA